MAPMIPDPEVLGKQLPGGCAVCGAAEFTYRPVLTQSLIDEWQLSRTEADYTDIQQGLGCGACSANLRSMVLAAAICEQFANTGTLQQWAISPSGQSATLLEINEAGSLTPHLSIVPGHRMACYPDVDMHALPFEDDSFDVVVHSDTLEHVSNPVHALGECRRVLRPGGFLAFTVPVIVGRLSRSRLGLPPSFHGDPAQRRPDFLVHTEFGADMWTFVIEAGFQSATLHTRLYPAAIALTAQK
jgi:SAM-dependent methyltransferase